MIGQLEIPTSERLKWKMRKLDSMEIMANIHYFQSELRCNIKDENLPGSYLVYQYTLTLYY